MTYSPLLSVSVTVAAVEAVLHTTSVDATLTQQSLVTTVMREMVTKEATRPSCK